MAGEDAQAPQTQTGNLTFAAHDVAAGLLAAWREDLQRLVGKIAALENMNGRLQRALAENAKEILQLKKSIDQSDADYGQLSKKLQQQEEINLVVSEECARLRNETVTEEATLQAKIAELNSRIEENAKPKQHLVLPPHTF